MKSYGFPPSLRNIQHVLFWYYEFPGNLQRRQFQSHLFSFLFSFISWEQRQENGDHTGLTGGFASVDGSAEGEKERVRIFMMRGKRRGGHGQDFYDEDQLWEKGVDQCFQSSRNILRRMRMMRNLQQGRPTCRRRHSSDRWHSRPSRLLWQRSEWPCKNISWMAIVNGYLLKV